MSIKTRPEETGLDELDPGTNSARDAVHFRRIQTAHANLSAAEDDLRESVQAARDAGDSWTIIGAALNITRQAAQQRFGGN